MLALRFSICSRACVIACFRRENASTSLFPFLFFLLRFVSDPGYLAYHEKTPTLENVCQILSS